MHDDLVINTGPLIALACACGDWGALRYAARASIVVPRPVLNEIRAGPAGSPGQDLALPPNVIVDDAVIVPRHLHALLDPGEAAVIAVALQRGIPCVAIDELAGRRVARVHGLLVTGSLGILVEMKRQVPDFPLEASIRRMVAGGVLLSESVIGHALKSALPSAAAPA